MKIDILQDNGWKTVDFPDGEQLPGIRNSCTIVPISVVLRELGFKVAWNGGTLSIKQDNKIVKIYEKRSYFEMIETIDGESDHIRYDHTDKKEIDSPVVGGRLLTPIRDVLESLCYIVLWDDASKNVKIIPPAENKITVRFNYNYGIEKSSDKPYFKRVSEGEAVTLPKPSRTGFVFDGWHIGRTDGTWVGDGKKSLTYYPTESVTLYAYWGRKYNITLVTNGGTVASQLLRVDIGQSVQLPTPDRTGFTFEGWFLNSDFQGEPVNAKDYHPTDHVTLYAKWRQLTASEIIDRFEQSLYVPDATKDSYEKRTTLLRIGRAMANSKKNYHPVFIIGMLGHMTGEGNIGLFELVKNTPYFEAMKSHNRANGDSYYDYYSSNYSFKYIYDNKSLSDVKKLAEELSNITYTDSNGNEYYIVFGLGCVQWTGERTFTIINKYLEKAGNHDTITFEQAAQAEEELILKELENSYQYVYDNWYDKHSGNLFSPESASDAGQYILLGYGCGSKPGTLDTIPRRWSVTATERTENAKLLYNHLITSWNQQ